MAITDFFWPRGPWPNGPLNMPLDVKVEKAFRLNERIGQDGERLEPRPLKLTLVEMSTLLNSLTIFSSRFQAELKL